MRFYFLILIVLLTPSCTPPAEPEPSAPEKTSPAPQPKQNASKVPADFFVKLISAGIAPWTSESRVEILADGTGTHFKWPRKTESRDKTEIKSHFTISTKAVERIYDQLIKSKALQLNSVDDLNVLDGDLAQLEITLAGKKNAFMAKNALHKELNAITRAINSELPQKYRIVYNALRDG